MRIHLLGQPRSGTTYLFNVIRQYYASKQHIEFGNEPFNSNFRDSRFFDEHINEIAKTKRCIIKNHTLHLEEMSEMGLMEDFNNLIDYTIVVWRRNIFELTASMCVSVTKNQWYAGEQDINPIYIGEHQFRNYWRGFYWETVKLKNNNYNINVDKWVSYDELTRDVKQDWLNLGMCMTDPAVIISFRSHTEISPPKHEIIKNYEDLRAYSEELCLQEERFNFKKKFSNGLVIKDNVIEDFTCN
tara:strand:+ start:7777 stop:8505 length:729 start_codon:yes stop_codon:yes gene_type:complete